MYGALRRQKTPCRSLPAFALDLWEAENTACAYGRDSKFWLFSHRESTVSISTLLHPPGSFKAAFPSAAAKMKRTIHHLKKGKPASTSKPCRHTIFHTHSEPSLSPGTSGFSIPGQIMWQTVLPHICLGLFWDLLFSLCSKASSQVGASLTRPTN